MGGMPLMQLTMNEAKSSASMTPRSAGRRVTVAELVKAYAC